MQLINRLYKENNIQILVLNNEMLMDPYGVGKCLDLNDVTVRRHITEMTEKQTVLVKASKVQSTNIPNFPNRGKRYLTESGVYKLILSSRKPSAIDFKNWVCDEVLPDIRKNGMFMTQEKIVDFYTDPEKVIEIMQSYAVEKARREKTEVLLAEAIRTKSHITAGKCASAMGKASGAVRRANRAVRENTNLKIEVKILEIRNEKLEKENHDYRSRAWKGTDTELGKHEATIADLEAFVSFMGKY